VSDYPNANDPWWADMVREHLRNEVDTVYLDLETATQSSVLAGMTPTEDDPRGESRAEWLAEHAGDRALDPIGGRVVAWALATSDELQYVAVDEEGDGERKLLLALAELLDDDRHRHSVVVAHNGHGVDFPFLRMRALALGLPDLARRLHQDKPWSGRLVDTKDWAPYPARGASKGWSITLNSLAETFGITRPPTVQGKDIPAAWYRREFDAVRDHVLDDVRTLRAVARILAGGRT
jgi:hypothetical protein